MEIHSLHGPFLWEMIDDLLYGDETGNTTQQIRHVTMSAVPSYELFQTHYGVLLDILVVSLMRFCVCVCVCRGICV